MSIVESFVDRALVFGPFESFARCRGCNRNLSSNNPASQYQRQKIIQKQVRGYSSVYTMNLGALNAYQKPNTIPETFALNGMNLVVSPGVNWNQMSDRRIPHIQRARTAPGTNPGGNSVRHVVTRLRPGALSPGGIGVDIKHNSYDRYLNRLKGRAPLRRGLIPPKYGREFIPFDPAFPIYGGKVVKTSMVNRCNCPEFERPIQPNEELLYTGADQDEIYNVKYEFNTGDRVIIITQGIYFRNKGTIAEISGIYIVVALDNGENVTLSNDQIVLFLADRCRIDPCAKRRDARIIAKEIFDSDLEVANGILKALNDRNTFTRPDNQDSTTSSQ